MRCLCEVDVPSAGGPPLEGDDLSSIRHPVSWTSTSGMIYRSRCGPARVYPGASRAACWSRSRPAVAATPPMNELQIIGALRGEPVPIVKCVTNDVWVPADAEYVLEGYLDPKGHTEPEVGPEEPKWPIRSTQRARGSMSTRSAAVPVKPAHRRSTAGAVAHGSSARQTARNAPR